MDLRHWKPSRKNPANIWQTVRVPVFGKINLTIFVRNHRYWVFIAAGKNGNRCHDEHFATQREALASAFEIVELLASD